MRRSWREALSELEWIDFELARVTDAGAASQRIEQRSALMHELSGLPVAEAGREEQVRLARAADRGRELEANWRRDSTRIRAEAESLYASQLLLRAMAPERRGSHFKFDS